MRWRNRPRRAWLPALALTALLLGFTPAARCHDHHGPPLQLLRDQPAGPYIVSLWAHAILGAGKVFVSVSPARGGAAPRDLQVSVGIQPADTRLAEKDYVAHPAGSDGEDHFETEASFDTAGPWNIRVHVQSSLGAGEATAAVEATTMGPSNWIVLVSILPFLSAGFLWARMWARSRRLRRMSLAG